MARLVHRIKMLKLWLRLIVSLILMALLYATLRLLFLDGSALSYSLAIDTYKVDLPIFQSADSIPQNHEDDAKFDFEKVKNSYTYHEQVDSNLKGEELTTPKSDLLIEWENMGDPKVMAAVTDEMKERVDEMRSHCNNAERQQKPKPYRYFMNVKELDMRWCKISKVGSSSWEEFLSQFAPICQKNKAWFKYCVKKQWAYPPQLSYSEWVSEREHDLDTDKLSFLTVRHPFERIVSAYRSKFENNRFSGYKFFTLFGKNAMLKYRAVSVDLTDREREELILKTEIYIKSGMARAPDPSNPYENPPWPTFAEFSEAVLMDGINHRTWWPINKLCSPCSINYSAIARMSTFDRDSAFLIRRIGLNPTGWPGKTNTSPGKPSEKVWDTYFNTLSRDFRDKYIEYYQKDCQMFGFDCDLSSLMPSATKAHHLDYREMLGLNKNILDLPGHHNAFGTKSPYHLVAGNISKHEFPCKPNTFFSLHRHGMRNIGGKSLYIVQINIFMEKLKKHFKTYKLATNVNMDWVLDFEYSKVENKDLTPEGYRQMIDSGERFKQTFPYLLADPRKVQVSTSSSARCVSSALSFLNGLYNTSFSTTNTSAILEGDITRIVGDVGEICNATNLDIGTELCNVFKPVISPSPNGEPLGMFHPNRDNLLRYFDLCPGCAHKKLLPHIIDDVPAKIWNGAPLNKLVKVLSTRLGLTLRWDEVALMHILCTMELTVPRLVEGARFCNVFKGEEMFVTNFFHDFVVHETIITPTVANASCIVMQEVIRTLTGNESSFYFGHTQTILPLFEFIGLITEELVEWKEDIRDRQYYGDMIPYGANFLMVAMDQCQDDAKDGSRIVETFLNEKLIEFPGCGTPCRLDRLEEMFPVTACHFHE